MSLFHDSALVGASGQAGGAGYSISRSLRFSSADSAYLSRTPASAGNRKTWTWAGWVKRVKSGNEDRLLYAGSLTYIMFTDDVPDGLTFANFSGFPHSFRLTTTRVFRDFSAWYHIVIAFDTTQATASDRIKMYVNGVQETVFTTSVYPNQNTEWAINSNTAHTMCGNAGGGSNYASVYLADIHFIDGQALDPTSFGEFSATTGVWVPKAYTGSYGTNGFHLDFADNSSNTATTLGKDTSGAGNNWTPNNLSVTAGAGNDSLVDVPTNGAETDTGAGGEVRGNYCTLNPLKKGPHITSVTNGNLEFESTGSSQYGQIWGTIGIGSGKWYWEGVMTAGGGAAFGWGLASANSLTSEPGGDANTWAFLTSGYKYNNGSIAAFGSSCAIGDVVGIAFDADTGALSFYKNGVSMGTAYTLTTGQTYAPLTGDPNSSTNCAATVNFGQRPFAYTAPSGFKALCTANLPAPLVTKASDLFQAITYTGNGGTQSVTTGFSPDLVWVKERNNITTPGFWDTLRGPSKLLSPNSTAGEDTTTALTSFDATGFTVLYPNSGDYYVNRSSQPYIAWCWDAGNTTVTDNTGSIQSTRRTNASAGFSVVSYTGGASGSTVGHGLNQTPGLIITKSRSNATGWAVYHRSLGKDALLVLNATEAINTTAPGFWGTPNSTTFGISDSGYFNNNGSMVAYCWAPLDGHSSFGSYTGNGSADGPFVFCNFRPRWILIKRTDSAGFDWIIFDSLRLGYNYVATYLRANLSNAEGTDPAPGTGSWAIDILSNGFKHRDATGTLNSAGATYVYAAFAESPFAANNRAR